MSRAKGDTEIKMNFTTGNAASARNVVREVYRNQISDMKSMNTQANALGLNFRKLGRSVGYGLAGYAGVTSASTMLAEFGRTYKAVTDGATDLEKAITPLSSLGDNAKDLASLRREAIGLSTLLDVPATQAAQMMFNLQSGTGNLSEGIRDDLTAAIKNMARATGGDLVTAEKLVTGSFQNFGDEVENVTQLSNKLLYTQDKASLTFEELGTRLAEVAATSDTVKVSIDELLGTLIGGTQKRIPVEKFFTGVRNVLLIMNDEEKQRKSGIDLTGTYIQQLEQIGELSRNNPGAFQKMFGQESVVVAQTVVNALDEIKASMAALSGITGETDAALAKLQTRMNDPLHAGAVIRSINARLQEQMPNIVAGEGRGASGGLKGMGRRFDLGALAMQEATGLDKDSWPVRWFGGVPGALGVDRLEFKGRAAELKYTEPGPERDELLRQAFEAKQAADLDKIRARRAMLFSPLAMFANPYGIAEDEQEILGRQFDLETARQRNPYGGLVTPSVEARDLANSGEGQEVLRVLRNIEMNTKPMGRAGAMPGGSRANSEETL